MSSACLCAGGAGLLFFKTRHLHRGAYSTCSTTTDVLRQDPRLDKMYLALESAGLLSEQAHPPLHAPGWPVAACMQAGQEE